MSISLPSTVKYESQNDLVLNDLIKFYSDTDKINIMLKIIQGEAKISLRLIDWFTTNYAKKNYTLYNVNNKRFKVHPDYRLQLRGYSKKRFDPFCRWERIVIPYGENACVETTIGQLNFFRWIIENKIIEYIEMNYDEIFNDMNVNSSSTKKKNFADNKTRKKREELSISAIRSIKKEDVTVMVKFNS